MTEPVHGLPPLLRTGLKVAAVPPLLRRDRWHEVTSVAQDGRSGQLVSLLGVSDIAGAEELAGSVFLACTDDLPEGFELHDVDALIGREVADATFGSLGTIVEVMVGAANDVWVIEGPYGEVLLPVVDEVVARVPSEGKIEVHAPAGSVGKEL